MADILIKGIEMPKGNNALVVDSAGTITKVNRWTGKAEATDPFHVKAVALPEHGDLIDRDKLYKDTEGIGDYCYDPSFGELCDALCDAPVIVEANYGTDN